MSGAFKRALVTGASGLLGRALLDQLASSGDNETVGMSSMDADLTDFAATYDYFATSQPEIVYYLAGRVAGIMGNSRFPGQFYRDNIRINTNVIEAARLVGARKVVAIGSTAIYSDLVNLPMSEDDIWLGPPHHSEAAYAHAKRAMLAQLQAYQQEFGLDYSYCISTNLFGMYDKFDEENGHVLPSLMSKFYRGIHHKEPVVIWGSGKPRRDFLYVKDAAYALPLIAERFTGPINLASGSTLSIAEAVDVVARVSGYEGAILWDRSKPDGQLVRSYEISRLRSIGFVPRYSFEDAVAETFSWLENHFESARR